MLDQLAEHKMRASFFGVIGRNPLGASLRRLIDRQYRERYLALGPHRVWSVLRHDRRQRRSTNIELPQVVALMRRIEEEGHELVLHGWDHRFWADHAWDAPIERLKQEIDRAYDAVNQALGECPRAWGSPNWRTRRELMATFRERDVPYLSESWGSSPFLCDGLLNLPVTDCLEPELLTQPRKSYAEAVSVWSKRRLVDGYRLLCCHDYFEGLLHPELFPTLLASCAAQGWRCDSLARYAQQLDRATLSEAPFERGEARGFVGEVSWQSEPRAAVISSSAS
jgi:peptidoglycan/xylan/chitin deacetylase (PgdA/CDA1 family)